MWDVPGTSELLSMALPGGHQHLIFQMRKPRLTEATGGAQGYSQEPELCLPLSHHVRVEWGVRREGYWSTEGEVPQPRQYLAALPRGPEPGGRGCCELTDMARCSGVLPCSPRASALAPWVSNTMTQSTRPRITITCRAVFPVELVLFTLPPRFSSMRAICGRQGPGPGRCGARAAPGHSHVPCPRPGAPESSSNGQSPGGRPQMWGWSSTSAPTSSAPQVLPWSSQDAPSLQSFPCPRTAPLPAAFPGTCPGRTLPPDLTHRCPLKSLHFGA